MGATSFEPLRRSYSRTSQTNHRAHEQQAATGSDVVVWALCGKSS